MSTNKPPVPPKHKPDPKPARSVPTRDHEVKSNVREDAQDGKVIEVRNSDQPPPRPKT